MTKLFKYRLIALFIIGTAHGQTEVPRAIVRMVPGLNHFVDGELVITPTANGVEIKGEVIGLTPGLHGFHIHEFGELGNSCADAGGHFNPFDFDHGDPRDLKRHSGDLGNIEADETGLAIVNIMDTQVSMNPNSRAFIGGLSVVVYADADDLGRGGNPASLKTGNAGGRMGCGIIEVQKTSNPEPTEEPTGTSFKSQMKAKVNLEAGKSRTVVGELTLTSTEQGVVVSGVITGLSPGSHGFHVHEKGELGHNCTDAGGHFNPFNANHGAPKGSERHVGDLGNVEADLLGTAIVNIRDTQASLDPSSEAYIGNRAIVIHEDADDLGRGRNSASIRTGNAGARLACGVILIDFKHQHEQLILKAKLKQPEETQPDEQPGQNQNENKTGTEKQPDVDFVAEGRTEVTREGIISPTELFCATCTRARVQMVPGSKPELVGELVLTATEGGVIIRGQITGLTPGLHGFHIHTNGALGNQCKDAGGHFNPFQLSHGDPSAAERHVGDLGNIKADENGTANIDIFDAIASMNPQSQAYIGGRAIVVHADPDDLGKGGNAGSLKTGNAGARMGCGIIQLESQSEKQEKGQKEIILPDREDPSRFQNKHFAIVTMVPGSTPGLAGDLKITPSGNGVRIEGAISGLTPGLHGFHIHQTGDLGKACKNAGGHFNPFQSNHGSPDDTERHVGDLGNILVGKNGRVEVSIFDAKASLDSSSPAYIGGRAIVVHAAPDDLGKGGNADSLKTGNAGARMGCGIIKIFELNQATLIAATNQEELSGDATQQFESATVKMVPGSEPNIGGDLSITSTVNGVLVEGQITGLSPGLHGFHIHTTGALGNKCKDAGGHFNPFGLSHGDPQDQERHVGDLGNIEADANGSANIRIVDAFASLDANSPAYIGNRAVVVHATADDLGKGGDAESLKTGNAGARMGCGIIQVQPQQQQEVPTQQRKRRSSFSSQNSYHPFSDPYRGEGSAGHSGGSVSSSARVKIIPGASKTVHGSLQVSEVHGGVVIKGTIYGLKPGAHGFHVHQEGKLGNKCKDAGPHFNPFNSIHGNLHDFHRHVGDLGNIKADSNGVAYINIFDKQGSLNPHSEKFIGHRALVVHADPDDLGRGQNEESKRTGNSGARVGCGVIDLEHGSRGQGHNTHAAFGHLGHSDQYRQQQFGQQGHHQGASYYKPPIYIPKEKPQLHLGHRFGYGPWFAARGGGYH